MSRSRCKPHGTCVHEVRRGGKSAMCATCGDVFPCTHDCAHYDCRMTKGLEVPAAVGYDPANPPTLAEMLGKLEMK